MKLNKDINFVGNVEGSHVIDDKCDVLVCDGFTGNAMLKLGESFYTHFARRGVQDEVLDMFNYESVGGSPILGVNGNVIIAHGVSSPKAIRNMLNLAVQTAKSNVSEKIKDFYN